MALWICKVFYSQFYWLCLCVTYGSELSCAQGSSLERGAKQGRLHPPQTLLMSWDSVHQCFVGIKVIDGQGLMLGGTCGEYPTVD